MLGSNERRAPLLGHGRRLVGFHSSVERVSSATRRDERSNEEETDGAKLQRRRQHGAPLEFAFSPGVLACRALTVRLGQLRQAVVLLVRDEVGQPAEEAAAQLALEDGVHLPQQHVLQLAGACRRGRESAGKRRSEYQPGCCYTRLLYSHTLCCEGG